MSALVPKIAHRFGCLNNQLCRLLWDTGCSDELITPLMATALISSGARWEYLEQPAVISHGNSNVVVAGSPCRLRVCLDVLIVHKGHTFQKDGVWFLVYEGCLPDAMLSEGLLNSIACVDTPGTSLIDTRTRESDLPILLQQMDDYQNLSKHRVESARQQLSVNSALSDAPPSSAVAATPAPAPPSAVPQLEHERIRQLLAEMDRQRASLMSRLGKPISDEAFAACMSVLDRYPDNFRPPGPDPCKLGVYKIVLKDKSKFHVALPRRVNPIMLAEMRRQIEDLVAQGAIERCTSRPASIYAIVMARRPNAPGKYRLCVDLVEGNANTVPAPYAIPEVQQALDRLSGKALYCTFDFSSWFHQFEIDEEDRDKVAFVVPGDNLTPPQIYRYKRVAFGLMNATYFCQRQLQEALEVWPGCEGIFPFVDDIVIATDSLDEMLMKLDSFMRFCQHYNIRLKKEKTELATTAVRHVGFILSKEGQHIDPARVDSLLSIGAPKTIDGLKSILGSFGFVRAWLADCAKTAAPLTDLMAGTAKRLKLDWGPEQDAALDALKLAVQLAAPKMAPDYTLPFHVYVDASDVGVAAVLVQFILNDKGERIPMAISHQSRRFAPREAKWEISVREMYAIKYGLFKFREYLQGCPNVTVHSDHLNLVNGLWKHSAPKIQRWRMFLESMRPFFLQHISGTDRMQLVADSLSRLHIENLRSRATAEELDPATMAMMQRGEGEDDAPMFGEAFTTSVGTQTSTSHPLTDIHVHNSNCAVFQSLTAEERAQQQTYGVGFNLISPLLNAAPPTSPLRTRPPHFSRPLQPSSVRGRPGIGFNSHRTAPSTVHASLHEISNIESALFVEEWTEEEEERKRSPQSQGTSNIWCNAMLSASSQTLPQDYQDLAYAQSGGFPLEEILKRAHDDTHPSFLCTYRRVIKALGPRPGASGAEIKDQVRRFCDSCLTCQKILPARTKLQIKAGTIRSRPFASYAFDVVTLSSPDADGNRYILVCVDSFSRAVELFALKQANAHEVFQALNDVLCRWGTPHELRCDNAKAFTSSIVRALLSRSHVRQHLTAPYSHQSNGQVENCNRRVMDILRSLVLDDRLGVNSNLKWSLLLPQVRRVIMTRTVTQHGCTPNELAYMHCPETEASIFDNEPWMPAVPTDALEPAWISNLAQQHQLIIDVCERKQDAIVQKLAATTLSNLTQSERKLQVGDCALLKISERAHSKIQAPWAGPYLVISFPRNDANAQMVELQHLSSKKTGLFHLNMLKFCDLTQLSTIEEAIPYAAKDSFEYEIAEILAHRPTGSRRQNPTLRAKNIYEFQCLWKDLDISEDNPSWEPWTNESMRSCEAYLTYTQRPEIEAELGKNF